MEEFAAKMGEEAWRPQDSRCKRAKAEALGGSRLLPERSPQARNTGLSFGWELFHQELIDPLAVGKS